MSKLQDAKRGKEMQPCNRKDICYNYPKHCELCQATSDVVNTYPCFQDKDIVEVVRCKDCVCFNNNMPTRPFCDYFGAAIDLMHFCSYGERKEE